MRTCKECSKTIGATNKTGLCLPCYNVSQRKIPQTYCKECDKKLDRKRNKSGYCSPCYQRIKNKDPEFIAKVSAGVRNSYIKNPKLREARAENSKIFGFGTDTNRAGMEREGHWRKQEDIPDFERYREIVRDITDKNYQENFYEIPNAKKRSREYHLDHKVSIAYGFENNIPAYIIAHHKNLEVIHHSQNESKYVENSITIKELLAEIDK
mgnify:CR=1 FL=1